MVEVNSSNDARRLRNDDDAATDTAADTSATHAAKRVRFSTILSSNDATRLAIVTSSSQLVEHDSNERGSVDTDNECIDEKQTLQQQQWDLDYFAPQFTYHAFGTDETIQGYNGLHISVLFSAFDFNALLDVRYKEQEPSADDIVAKITPSLPQGFTRDRAAFRERVRSLEQHFAPLGQRVESYTKQIDDHLRQFEIYEAPLVDSIATQQLLANMQMLALWFIEGADAVDVSDPRWVLYVTYERIDASSTDSNSNNSSHSSSGDAVRYAPVGYVTLFKFVNPLSYKKRSVTTDNSEQNETHRICQVLVLPTYQRQGHGEQLVQCIAQRAVENPKVFELTIEDPVPAFAQLRTLVDVKSCVARGFFSRPPSASADATAPAQGTASLQAADIRAVQEALKITHKQVQLCYEVLKWRFVDQNDVDALKTFRLEIKKRLFKQHGEELEAMASAERRKAFLEVEYQALVVQFDQLLAKIAH